MLSKKGIDSIPTLIKELYSIVDSLEEHFPDKKFTPDGHLVGSIGEVLVAYHYNLELLKSSYETHDAITKDGKMVQIKATQGNTIGIRSNPDYLIVIKILPDGNFEEYYNGIGDLAWNECGKMQKNGQRSISLSKLRKLMNKMDKTMIKKCL